MNFSSFIAGKYSRPLDSNEYFQELIEWGPMRCRNVYGAPDGGVKYCCSGGGLWHISSGTCDTLDALQSKERMDLKSFAASYSLPFNSEAALVRGMGVGCFVSHPCGSGVVKCGQGYRWEGRATQNAPYRRLVIILAQGDCEENGVEACVITGKRLVHDGRRYCSCTDPEVIPFVSSGGNEYGRNFCSSCGRCFEPSRALDWIGMTRLKVDKSARYSYTIYGIADIIVPGAQVIADISFTSRGVGASDVSIFMA